MTIIIITAVIGIIIFFLPFKLKKLLGKNFPAKIQSYWKAGLYFLVISFLYSAFIANLSDKIFNLPHYIYAVIIALIVALFTELGRFFILDKLIKVRGKNDLIEFGLGYLSISTVISGLFLIISSFVYFYFLQHPNLTADFGYLDKLEFANIQLLQEISLKYLAQNPLIALLPLFERTAELLLSIYLSFLIAAGIENGKQSKIWQGVLIRVVFLFLLFLKPFGENELLNELLDFSVYGGLGIYIYFRLKQQKFWHVEK